MDVLGENKREGLGRKAIPRVSLFLFLIVSIILLLASLYTAEASVFRKARESVLDATAPIMSFLAGPVGAINNVIGGVNDYFDVVDENRALRQENAELRQWMEEALALREIVSVYEKLQTYETPPDYLPIDGHVIGDSNDAFVKSMVVNAGREKSVRIGLAVVNEAGLIGRVIEAGRTASRVLLLTDVQSRIPVYIETHNDIIEPVEEGESAKRLRKGIEGILVGRTNSRPVISFTNEIPVDPIEPGMRIFTSGSGGVIPRGLPVGAIESVEDTDIEVSLYANYARTRLVRILNYGFPKIESDIDESRQETAQQSGNGDVGASNEGGGQ